MPAEAPSVPRSSSRRDAPPCRTLAQYVALLIERLEQHEPASVARIRALVGRRRARISLDQETIIVCFSHGDGDDKLVIEDAGGHVGGSGVTTRDTVLGLLDGYAEVTDVILDGRLAVHGDIDDVARMFQSIEVLIDGATRVPSLQQLARDFRGDPCRTPVRPRVPRALEVLPPRARVSPRDLNDGEMTLLARLDLLPPLPPLPR